MLVLNIDNLLFHGDVHEHFFILKDSLLESFVIDEKIILETYYLYYNSF